MPQSLFDRWNEKVERSDEGCWIWRGALTENGYGVIQRGPRGAGLIRAHRFAYERYKGPIPLGLEIRHSCHTRSCVNPAHLSVGTRTDNMADMVRAGRWSKREPMRGSTNGHSKLTEEQALAIRNDQRTLRIIAEEYAVSLQTIWSIRHGKTWTHI